MKKAILLAVCLFTVSATINAQEAPTKAKTEKTSDEKARQKMTPEQRAQKQVDDLNTDGTLSEDQKSKIYVLTLKKVNKADEIRAKYKGQPENKETAEKELEIARKEYHQSVKALLTPAQLEKMKAKKEENKAQKGLMPAEKQ